MTQANQINNTGFTATEMTVVRGPHTQEEPQVETQEKEQTNPVDFLGDLTDTDLAFQENLGDALGKFTGAEAQQKMQWFEQVMDALAKGFPDNQPDQFGDSLMRLDDFLNLEIPPSKPMITGLLDECESMLVHAPAGAGKSIVVQMLSLWLSGDDHSLGCWGNSGGNHTVMYVDGEMNAPTGQSRFRGLTKLLPATGSNFIYFNAIRSKATNIHLLDTGYQDSVIKQVVANKVKLVVLDNWRTMAGGGDENNAATVNDFNKFIDALHANGCSTIVIHHSNKAAGADGWPVYSGTTNFERPYSVVMGLKTQQVYNQDNPKQVMGFKITKQRASNLATREGIITIDDNAGITVTGHGAEPVEFTEEEAQTVALLEHKHLNILDDDFKIPHGKGTVLWDECCKPFHGARGFPDSDSSSKNLKRLLDKLGRKKKLVDSTKKPFMRVTD